jgi:hypothetical protein
VTDGKAARHAKTFLSSETAEPFPDGAVSRYPIKHFFLISSDRYVIEYTGTLIVMTAGVK